MLLRGGLRGAQGEAAAAAAEPSVRFGGSGGETAAARGEEAAARVAAMSADEVAEAQAELAQRLGADKLAFFKGAFP